MTEIDQPTQAVLDKLESICKDRFSGYVIIVVDADCIYNVYSSKVLAMGAAEYIKEVIRKEWEDG